MQKCCQAYGIFFLVDCNFNLYYILTFFLRDQIVYIVVLKCWVMKLNFRAIQPIIMYKFGSDFSELFKMMEYLLLPIMLDR